MTEKGEISNFHLLPNLLMETLWHVELGVGYNTPVIIKFGFHRMTAENPKATYVCVNYGQAYAPNEILDRSIVINGDAGEVISKLMVPEVGK